ncbi:dephospho-CoA kinase, long form [Corynebacterium sp. TAE3-ERU12]|uniref:dephospho-CoA kinase n=1 Tax=Corynebacterium sp. TAE3-ERU12 TaxID=2849491 RepID=UPI001C48E83A|nr:dephospho-CoA kinase [Corynebacterium sp. TAE3-ERU12]MBV7296137.1 dephospho-CoA kinase, long form [Corynebacterium sp. TAE3-ERU12]
MIKVGLTGGMGSGKSSVASRLRERGALIVDADAIAREIVSPGQPALAELADAFGADILNADGTLNRAELARRAFADNASREKLNAITHPRIAQRTQACFAAAGENDIVIHDMPLLVENDLAADNHLVIVVHAPVETRIERLCTSRGVDAEDARRRIASQSDDATRLKHADVIVDNSRTREALREQVDLLWTRRILPMRSPQQPGVANCPEEIAAPARGRLDRERERIERIFDVSVIDIAIDGGVVCAQVDAPLDVNGHPWDVVGDTWTNRDLGNPVVVTL